jgi:hypothetical protein
MSVFLIENGGNFTIRTVIDAATPTQRLSCVFDEGESPDVAFASKQSNKASGRLQARLRN